MTEAELLRVIEQAARNGVTELYLEYNQLRSLPAEIGQLTGTKTEFSRCSSRNSTTVLPII
ncbi:MAG: hypothetical protein F6K62_15125 [Sphaerospermopsis sp. SIO1G2]|nr:hypothetical protein [Sphaerospermopsis sp. SIO1G2]